MSGEKGARRKGRPRAYLDVYRHFADLIDSGQLKPGDRLPRTWEIEEQHSVSHATASKAIRLLKEEGYVRSSTQGVFVHLMPHERLLHQLSEALNALEEAGQSPVLETNRNGSCIAGRSGAVCWSVRNGRWETEIF